MWDGLWLWKNQGGFLRVWCGSESERAGVINRGPVFKDLGNKLGEFPHAERAAECVLSLPMSLG